MKKIKIECRMRMQLCAILSQLHRHKDALKQSRESVKLAHLLIKDLHSLCDFYMKKLEAKDESTHLSMDEQIVDERGIPHFESISVNTPTAVAATHNYLEDSMSLIERSAKRLMPVVEEILQRMVVEEIKLSEDKRKPEEAIGSSGGGGRVGSSGTAAGSSARKRMSGRVLESGGGAGNKSRMEADMRGILGYLNQTEWVNNLNIGNIMQISPLALNDMLSVTRNEMELSREGFLDKVHYPAITGTDQPVECVLLLCFD